MENRVTAITDMVYAALGAVLIAVCAWISLPFAIPVTMQTFAVFLVSGMFGGRRGTMSVVIYMLLGCVGLPVFTGFRGGVHVLAGPTGGYLLGFLIVPLIVGGAMKLGGRKMWVCALSMTAGLILCYAFGTAWFKILYMHRGENIGILTVLGTCVFPFIIPDVLKIGLAVVVMRRIARVGISFLR